MSQNIMMPYNVYETIPAGTTQVFEFPIYQEGTIERLRQHFNPGPQGTLHVSPKLIRRDGQPVNLFNYTGGNAYLAGDDEELLFPLSRACEGGDTLQITAVNTDATNDHICDTQILVDYLGGKRRVV